MNAKERNAAVVAFLDSADIWDMTLPWLPIYWDLNILARYQRAGYKFVSLTLQDWPPTFEGMHRCIREFKELAESAGDWLTFATSIADIDRGRYQGRLVVGLNSQETLLIGDDLTRLTALYDLGVRHMLLAYNVRNAVADGCAEKSDAGLSNFGRRVVKEMNRVGIVVDCSHTGLRSSLEAIDLSEQPAIFSHSNARALCPHFRNIHDEQIRACASRGGVIGVVGVGAFLGDAEARSESVFRQIDYMCSLVGSEHVGLGTDYVNIFPASEHSSIWETISARVKVWPDPTDAWPETSTTVMPVDESRCFSPEQLEELIELMLAHGYSTGGIKGILGGNFRRVYESMELHRDAKSSAGER